MSTATQTATKKRQYRVLVGRHFERDENGVRTGYGQGFPSRDFWSTRDILAYNGGPGAQPKYAEILPGMETQLSPTLIQVDGKGIDSDLLNMTKEELLQFAKENEIDLGKAKNKEEIAAAIQAAMNA